MTAPSRSSSGLSGGGAGGSGKKGWGLRTQGPPQTLPVSPLGINASSVLPLSFSPSNSCVTLGKLLTLSVPISSFIK